MSLQLLKRIAQCQIAGGLRRDAKAHTGGGIQVETLEPLDGIACAPLDEWLYACLEQIDLRIGKQRNRAFRIRHLQTVVLILNMLNAKSQS